MKKSALTPVAETRTISNGSMISNGNHATIAPISIPLAHHLFSPATEYALPGPQVEPDASLWTQPGRYLPRVVQIEPELTNFTDDPTNAAYFPAYPDAVSTQAEIDELIELSHLRDDPAALHNNEAGRPRRKISRFLQLRPQPFGAAYNSEYGEHEPVIKTGRELARWFEAETPGLGHRHALNFLLPLTGWSPPRQARVWAALDLTIYSAILAAWHYKWHTSRSDVRYRPRPYEVDQRIGVLYNWNMNVAGMRDTTPHSLPNPSPGTPRHPAYPSGHSTVGGAASEMLCYFFPDLRADFDDLADNAGMARLWAGIHYRSDHEQGIKLGRTVAQMIIAQLGADGVPEPTTMVAQLGPQVLPPANGTV